MCLGEIIVKIGEIYCMNLFDFLENWHPNTLIIVEAEDCKGHTIRNLLQILGTRGDGKERRRKSGYSSKV